MSMDMITGTLTINLKPPYLSFQSAAGSGHEYSYLTECEVEDIQRILLELGVHESYRLPGKDGIVRSKGQFSIELLEEFGLIDRFLVGHQKRMIKALA